MLLSGKLCLERKKHIYYKYVVQNNKKEKMTPVDNFLENQIFCIVTCCIN